MIEDLRGDRERMLEAKDAIAPDIAIGRLSRLDALSEKGVRMANLQALETRIIRLESRLKEIDSENFSKCGRCGRQIPAERMIAMPDSELCVKCA